MVRVGSIAQCPRRRCLAGSQARACTPRKYVEYPLGKQFHGLLKVLPNEPKQGPLRGWAIGGRYWVHSGQTKPQKLRSECHLADNLGAATRDWGGSISFVNFLV
jgi:hypothetical protein